MVTNVSAITRVDDNGTTWGIDPNTGEEVKAGYIDLSSGEVYVLDLETGTAIDEGYFDEDGNLYVFDEYHVAHPEGYYYGAEYGFDSAGTPYILGANIPVIDSPNTAYSRVKQDAPSLNAQSLAALAGNAIASQLSGLLDSIAGHSQLAETLSTTAATAAHFDSQALQTMAIATA